MSLQRLGLNYVDLYLIHMPFSFKHDANSSAPAANSDGTFVLDTESDPIQVWKVINN